MQPMQHTTQDDRLTPTRRRRFRFKRLVVGLATATLAVGAASPALAAGHGYYHRHAHYRHAIELVAVTPGPGDVAGRAGAFNIDLALLARDVQGNAELSAANGYQPGLNLPPATTAGPGKSDPNVPGLVVTLSTTPAAAGGPNANLAGLFQLNAVAQSFGQQQVFADWEVGKPGLFGDGTRTTLTAYVVAGTASGIVTGAEQPISNVIRETFTIGS